MLCFENPVNHNCEGRQGLIPLTQDQCKGKTRFDSCDPQSRPLEKTRFDSCDSMVTKLTYDMLTLTEWVLCCRAHRAWRLLGRASLVYYRQPEGQFSLIYLSILVHMIGPTESVLKVKSGSFKVKFQSQQSSWIMYGMLTGTQSSQQAYYGSRRP